jgi:hypothetical protein
MNMILELYCTALTGKISPEVVSCAGAPWAPKMAEPRRIRKKKKGKRKGGESSMPNLFHKST